MAKLYGEIAKSALLTLDKSFSRALGQPLDASEVYYSLEAAQTYAATPAAYIGQKIVVIEDDKITHYSVEDAAGTLKELGAKPVGDGKSIAVDASGIVSILGAAEADSLTLPRMKEDKSGIEWVPVSQVVEGDGNDNTTYEITALQNGEETYGIKVKTLFNNTAVEGGEFEIGFDVYTKSKADEKFLAKADYTPYDETALANRVKAIEDDYLKEADKYDDTALAARVKVIEDDYLKEEDKYDDTALAGRVTTLETAVNHKTTGLGAHEARIQAMETFWSTTEDADNVVNTLKEIQEYIASDESGASTMAANIKTNTDAIAVLNGNEEGSVNKKITDAIAPLATTEALDGVKATAEAAQTAQEVSDAIDAKITAQNLGQYAKSADVATTLESYAKSADVVSNETFEQFKTDNSTAISAKANSSDVYKKTETYNQSEVDGLIADFVVQSDIDAAVAAEAEIARTAEKANANAIAAIKDDANIDSFADVVAELAKKQNSGDYATKTEAKGYADAKDAAITAAQTQADKGVSDAATAKQRADEAYNLADSNKTNLSTLTSTVEGYGTTLSQHSTKIGTLETTVSEHTGKFTTIESNVNKKADQTALDALVETVGTNGGNITNLTTKVTANETAIKTLNETTIPGINNTKANKSDVYTKTEVGTITEGKTLVQMIEDAQVAATYDDAGVKADIQANAEAIAVLNSDATVAGSVAKIADDRIAAALAGADTDFDTLKEMSDWLSTHSDSAATMNSNIQTNTAAITKLNGDADTEGSVLSMIAANAPSVATGTVLGLVMSSSAENKISVADDGIMEVNSLNVNKLVQTAGDTLVLFGGNASV